MTAEEAVPLLQKEAGGGGVQQVAEQGGGVGLVVCDMNMDAHRVAVMPPPAAPACLATLL